MFDRFFDLIRAVPEPDDAELLYGDDEPGRLRERNLRRYLELPHAPILLLGEAPGWRGMTVTGVPFTSVREVEAGVLPGLELPSGPQAPWEASSRVFWATMEQWQGPLPLSWPVYPHHPFVPGHPQTNRTPRSSEVRQGGPVALELIRALGVQTVVAVGRKAQGALAEAGIEAPAVRHPAQGGARMFTDQLLALNRAMLDAG
ncbi:uracil-DNA glycosylase family protein [Leifsonia sp. fls2-241-R2A-40a]|uniref:uracil-DNA glycosylase family protein n=1 Tax=Leifsonia sp. fls2-241-R2A-40a TaxID=3040290 RepID=UPI00254EE483|nr:uracil-DNA glycosylase family protein [Leifsonia sp. fls2-241-R2A-40a]